MVRKTSLKIVSIEELQAVLKDINKLGVYEPPFNEKESDIDVILDELQEIALNEDDPVSEKTKQTLNNLEIGPWFKESPEGEVEEVMPEKTKTEGNIDNSKTPKKDNKIEMSTPKKEKKIPVKKEKKERYTRMMAFANALREGGKDDEELIAKAHKLYQTKSSSKKTSIKVAATIHMYGMGALRTLDLIKEKDGKITV